MNPNSFQKIVLHWYDFHGRKTLPWQREKTPYTGWVSEIMLQQTQVQTVIPYFERFIKRFPHLSALAKANEDEVLHFWAGLGYYSRARNLLKTAQKIYFDLHNCFPDQLEDLTMLPGIGRSTAGAILALGFNKQGVILDGNVRRLFIRLKGLKDSPATLTDRLWNLAEKYTPKERNADYVQVLMDLGATICLPRNPLCHQCPLKQKCIAYQENIQNLLPIKTIKKELPIQESTFLMIRYQNKILLEKRQTKGIWQGLWSLPEILHKPNLENIYRFCEKEFGYKINNTRALPLLKHTFTHFKLHIYPIEVFVHTKSKSKMAENDYFWYSSKSKKKLGLPKPVQFLIDQTYE